MERKIKRSLVFVIAIIMVISSISIAFANELPAYSSKEGEKSSIAPYWIGLNTVSNNFQILAGGLANPTVWGTTYSGDVDYVNIGIILKRSNGSSWTTIKSWNQNKTISNNMFSFDETYTVIKGYNYKYTATVKSYKNNTLLDTISFDSKIVTY